MNIVLFSLLGLAVILGALHLVASARFRATIAALVATLRSGPAGVPREDLPPVLREFALRGGAGGGVPPRAVRIKQDAEFRRSADADWGPMPAVQHVAIGMPGFVWAAEAPGWIVPQFAVIDAFVSGQGQLEARLFGSIPVASAKGPVADRAEAMRYLAELAWAPDAVLGNPAIGWEVLSDTEVAASLDMPAGRAEVVLIFDAGGDIVGMRADDRPEQMPDGTILSRRWRGVFGDYAEIGGRRIPTTGEVGYVDEDGTYGPYWRGRITDYAVLP